MLINDLRTSSKIPLMLLIWVMAGSLIKVVQAQDGNKSYSTHLTATQAVDLARTYCKSIGQPIVSLGSAIYPLTSYRMDDSWLPQWKVSFPGKAEVHVIDDTGVISFYDNKAYFDTQDTAAPGTPITQESAVRIGTGAVAASGQKESLAAPQAKIMLLTPHHPLAIDNFWSLNWTRMSQDIPYLDDGASVALNAQTGELVNMQLVFRTTPLARTVTSVTQNQAVGFAARHLIYNVGITVGATLRDVNLKVVTVRTGSEKIGRVAWIVRYLYHSRYGARENDTWIDAENGDIVGGQDAGPMGVSANPKPPVAPKLSSLLPSVQTVYVRSSDGSAIKRGNAPIAMTFTGEQVKALQNALMIEHTAFSGKAPFQIALVSTDEIGVYDYYPNQSQLGTGQVWANIPKDLNAQIVERISTLVGSR